MRHLAPPRAARAALSLAAHTHMADVDLKQWGCIDRSLGPLDSRLHTALRRLAQADWPGLAGTHGTHPWRERGEGS